MVYCRYTVVKCKQISTRSRRCNLTFNKEPTIYLQTVVDGSFHKFSVTSMTQGSNNHGGFTNFFTNKVYYILLQTFYIKIKFFGLGNHRGMARAL